MITFAASSWNRTRIAQHVGFWLVVFGIFTVIYSLNLGYTIALRNECFYVPVHMMYFYAIAYWLLPRYLFTTKYVQFVMWVITLMLVATITCRLIFIFLVDAYQIDHLKLSAWARGEALSQYNRPFFTKLINQQAFINALKTINMVVWIALGIKLFKLWYERKQAAAYAELKALKAQVHPHFLFNTLNNLYALTLSNSPQAPGIVLGLSDMLRYMLYECNADRVSLKNEVLMLQQYIGLEKIRYEDRLDLTFTINGRLDDKLIAPLLLLPLVENAFKHGTSERIGAGWINIDLDVTGNKLKFKVSNSKAENQGNNPENYSGRIGLENIRKRLELLYPSTHQFKIINEDDIFFAMLEVELNIDPKPVAKQLATA